jgi:hypothetical protein
VSTQRTAAGLHPDLTRLKTKPTGSEFVAQVSDSLGENLRFGKWVAMLYDACESRGENRVFNQLAFEAKSLQRLTRLSSKGISDNSAKDKVQTEISNTLQRFSQLLEQSSSLIQENDSRQFRMQFLGTSKESFDSLIGLLDDFVKVKDYYLKNRDSSEKV